MINKKIWNQINGGIRYYRLIISFLVLCLFSSSIYAAKFAYIPILRESGVVYVVDTSVPEIVSSIPAYNPTGVAINSDGSKVYVTQRFINSEGNVIIIDAHKNEILDTKIEDVGLEQPASLVYHPGTNSLFITHNLGITKIGLDIDGLPNGEKQILPAEFNSGEIDYFGDYIFSTGEKYDEDTKKSWDSGVSMFRASNGDFISEISLENSGTIGIGVDPENSRLYITNRTKNSVSVLKVSDTGLVLEETIQLKEGSAPFGVAYDPSYERLYIANTATTGGFEDYGVEVDGNQVAGTLASVELKQNTKTIEYESLSVTDNQYAFASSLHPLALNYDSDNDELFVIKDLWLNLNGGTYLSIIRNGLTGLDIQDEIHLQIDARNKPQFSGRFLGPECNKCPGSSTANGPVLIRRSGLEPIMLAILFPLFYLVRRFEKQVSNT